MKLNEAIKLLARIPKNPVGAYDEIKIRFELYRENLTVPAPSYQPINFDDAISGIENVLQKDLRGFLNESALAEIEETVVCNIKELYDSKIPFPLGHNGGTNLSRFCYVLCRALKPEIFVETGVAYGVTSSFILKAFEVNNRGKLYSVDRPPKTRNAAKFIGALIPNELRHNWLLRRGESQKLLPVLLSELNEIDIFLHDSRHTYNNMSAEFQMIAPYLANQSVVLADDANRNIAFQEWAEQTCPLFSATVGEPEKQSLFGVSFFSEKPNYRKQ